MRISKLPVELNVEDCGFASENIPLNIRKARESVGLSQLELGRMLGYRSPVALSLMESGDRKVSALNLWKIAHITSEPVKNFFLRGLIGNDTPLPTLTR